MPQRGIGLQPKVGRQRLPWVHVRKWKQRQRRCGHQPNVAATPPRWVTNQTNRTTSTRLWPFVRGLGKRNGTTRLRLGMVGGRWPRVAEKQQVAAVSETTATCIFDRPKGVIPQWVSGFRATEPIPGPAAHVQRPFQVELGEL